MDTPTSAAPDEKTPPLELALATQLKSATQEKPKPSGPLEISAERFNSSVARLTSNSIEELQGLVSELQKMQEFLKSEVDNVQRQIDSALAGINIIVETIGPWKSLAGSQTLPSGTRNVRAGGPAANIEQRNSSRVATVGARRSAIFTVSREHGANSSRRARARSLPRKQTESDWQTLS